MASSMQFNTFGKIVWLYFGFNNAEWSVARLSNTGAPIDAVNVWEKTAVSFCLSAVVDKQKRNPRVFHGIEWEY